MAAIIGAGIWTAIRICGLACSKAAMDGCPMGLLVWITQSGPARCFRSEDVSQASMSSPDVTSKHGNL